MHKDRTFCEQDEKKIEELLLGHKVTVDDYDNLVLDNGVVLQIYPNIGCYGCESGNYYFKVVNMVEFDVDMDYFAIHDELDCVVLHDEYGVMDDMVFVPLRTVDDDEE